jgi:site-specific DNA recombinase
MRQYGGSIIQFARHTGPSNRGWGASTIHGNRQRGTGILNNELYIGKLVWNRLRYIKDPETGKRVSRPNAESELIVHDVQSLRIIDDELWQAVKDRQADNAADWNTDALRFWDRKRPHYLFSGLMRCGVCGGGIINLNSVRVGCANARNKGTCDNRRTLRRDTLEQTVLDGLREHMMAPELFAAFCDEYTRHMNLLRMEASASLDGARSELKKIAKDIDRLIDAICSGVAGTQVKDRMAALENRKTELERKLNETDEPQALLHPNMALHYRLEVSRLHEALADDAHRDEAVEITRALVDAIVLTPVVADGRQTTAIDIRGHMAGILALAAKTKKPPRKDGNFEFCVFLVAGVGFEPTTFRL